MPPASPDLSQSSTIAIILTMVILLVIVLVAASFLHRFVVRRRVETAAAARHPLSVPNGRGRSRWAEIVGPPPPPCYVYPPQHPSHVHHHHPMHMPHPPLPPLHLAALGRDIARPHGIIEPGVFDRRKSANEVPAYEPGVFDRRSSANGMPVYEPVCRGFPDRGSAGVRRDRSWRP